jgi:hypothetical protein
LEKIPLNDEGKPEEEKWNTVEDPIIQDSNIIL